jgi:hypothetical protein
MPLPLVTFEQHMLFDNRPAYPMNCLIRLHFSGRVRLEALESALATALTRHSLLRSRVRESGRRQEWVPSPSWPTICAVSPCDGGRLPCAGQIDLRHEPGLRAWVAEDDRGFNLSMYFHHACCDAMGAFSFLEDLLTVYAAAANGGPVLRDLDEESLQRRGRYASLSGSLRQMVQQRAVRLLRAWRFAVHTPVSLGSPVPRDRRDTLPDDYPAILSRQLTAAESSRLRQAASEQDVTLNDLLTRDWFIAVHDWQTRHYPGRRGRPLRLCVPINLRTEEHRRLPAANVLSMVFVERREKDLANPGRLLQGIHREMALTKRLCLGPAFVQSIGVLEKVPHRLLHAIDPGGCWASGVLTNLGVVLNHPVLPKRVDGRLEIGGAVLERIDAMPPLRPATNAAFTALTYAGRLSLTLHFDSRAIDPAHAVELIDAYVQQLRPSMGISSIRLPAASAWAPS